MSKTNKSNWEAINQYIERNTVTSECRLIGTTDIIPNLRYDNEKGIKNYAVKSFREKRSLPDTTDIYKPVRDTWIDLGNGLELWNGREYWKPIPYNDYYQVSTWGNVRNSKGNYLSPGKNKKGYLHVVLCKTGYKPKTFRVNRLVAEAFLPNPENLSDVDHWDSKRDNNMVDNLQWLSHADNVRKDQAKRVKRVIVATGETFYYDSAKEAASQTGFNISAISTACNGIYSKYKGHHYKDSEWYYVE